MLTSARILASRTLISISPQATLAACYNNGKVFEGVVKIRRGKTARIVTGLNSYEDLVHAFYGYAGDIAAAVQPAVDPSAKETLQACKDIQDKCEEMVRSVAGKGGLSSQQGSFGSKIALFLLALGYASYAFSLGGVRESLGVSADAGDPMIDLIQKIIAVLCVLGLSVVLCLE